MPHGLTQLMVYFPMFNILRNKNADVVLLQETHSNKKSEKIWRNEWGGNIYYSYGESNARGTCIMIKPHTKIDVKRLDTEILLVV